eukprot:4063892-Amphidinium_carterae.1
MMKPPRNSATMLTRLYTCALPLPSLLLDEMRSRSTKVTNLVMFHPVSPSALSPSHVQKVAALVMNQSAPVHIRALNHTKCGTHCDKKWGSVCVD